MADIGYSGTPLAKKLGLKDGQHVVFVDLPAEVNDLAASRLFASCREINWAGLNGLALEQTAVDLIHVFTTERENLVRFAGVLVDLVRPDGAVWVSWPKKASKVPTDVTEDVIREVLLPTGLVDVKVCAVNGVWSGLKLVIRKELR